MERIGIFVGSFDPFTIGHDSIVRRALPLFDRLVIGVGVNEKKHYMLTAEERVETIRGLYDGEKKISVEQYSDLTVDFAQRHGAQFIVKGVRSVKDFEFEREQAGASHFRTRALRSGHKDSSASELLPLHRAKRRDGHLLPHLWR